MDTQNNPQQAALVQLKDYIKHQLQTGLQPDEITTQLRQAGWQDDIIRHGFQLVQADVMPSFTPAASPTPSGPTAMNPAGPSQVMPGTVKRGRIKTSWILLKQSLRVLKNNKGLLRYVFMTIAWTLLLIVVLTLVAVFSHGALVKDSAAESNNLNLTPLGYVVVVIYYTLGFFIVNFYSAGLVANVIDLFRGTSQPYKNYMKVAKSRIVPLLVFSLVEATVGLILRLIAERSRLLGRLIAWLIGAAWSLARLFTVPVIVTTQDNAVTAIKRSTKLLVGTWGENLVGRVSFGVITFLVMLLIFLPCSIGLVLLGGAVGGNTSAFIAIMLVILLYFAFLVVIYTASNILNTALFYYAAYRQVPAAFDPQLINSVFVSRKRRKLFGKKKDQ